MFIQDIPEPFIKRFGKDIPFAVLCALKNGKMFEGRYSKSESMLYGLMDLVTYTNLDMDDALMCTYWGNGQFDIVVFDKSKIERSIEQFGDRNGKKSVVCKLTCILFTLFASDYNIMLI